MLLPSLNPGLPACKVRMLDLNLMIPWPLPAEDTCLCWGPAGMGGPLTESSAAKRAPGRLQTKDEGMEEKRKEGKGKEGREGRSKKTVFPYPKLKMQLACKISQMHHFFKKKKVNFNIFDLVSARQK